jgi:hypothetical protein
MIQHLLMKCLQPLWSFFTLEEKLQCLFLNSFFRDQIGNQSFYAIHCWQEYTTNKKPHFYSVWYAKHKPNFAKPSPLQKIKFKYWSPKMFNQLFLNAVVLDVHVPKFIQCAYENPSFYYSIDPNCWDRYLTSCTGVTRSHYDTHFFKQVWNQLPKKDNFPLPKLFAHFQNKKRALTFDEQTCVLHPKFGWVTIPKMQIVFYPQSVIDTNPLLIVWQGQMLLCTFGSDGSFYPKDHCKLFDLQFLSYLNDDVITMCILAGKKLNICVFCHLPLTDPVSMEQGYGKDCAAHLHLPYPKKCKRIKTTC